MMGDEVLKPISSPLLTNIEACSVVPASALYRCLPTTLNVPSPLEVTVTSPEPSLLCEQVPSPQATLAVNALVASAVAITYVLNQNETPGTIKALAVAFGGYVIALMTAAYRGDS